MFVVVSLLARAFTSHDCVKRAAFGKAAELRVGAEQLRWVKAQRDGGATPQEYAEALLQHPNPKAGGAKVPLKDLDPTQRSFGDVTPGERASLPGQR